MSATMDKIRYDQRDSLLLRRAAAMRSRDDADRERTRYRFLAGLKAAVYDEAVAEIRSIDARLDELHQAEQEG